MEKEALDYLIAVARMFIIMAGLCAVGIAAGIPAAKWMGNRIGHLLSGLSDEKYDGPCPLLGPAAAMAVRGDLNGALLSYQCLLDDHPNEPEIYWRMLEISLGPLKDREKANEILELARLNLQDEHSKSAIVRLVEEIDRGRYLPFRYLADKNERGAGTIGSSISRIEPPPLKAKSMNPA